ncbi:MAG: Glu-tRNA(Gln) amidotransferase subunit GatE, partial [candidate division Zixibacteria bacterium]|nr:Glu-tRNA(Gln) amidotransferase subunit GatE [candidate division Zixibacteria bacterium]
MSDPKPIPSVEVIPDQRRPRDTFDRTRALTGYVHRRAATPETYRALGFKCGLEIHQQLKTSGKLFCRCPARRYQKPDDFDAEIIRHMRPTLSELGEYDGTALMEFKTRKTIVYRLRNESACTYEIDDTPPFLIDREALRIALRISLILNMTVVGELHVTRKQYLDGSIPTGFQRTGIVAIEGHRPLKEKTVRIIQLSIEEDSCREVSDIGHTRVFRTDRLGMPLIETVTYPDMLTPDEAAEAAQYLRFLARSSGEVRTGIGAAREDVNVSITGGTRVEIKGVSKIRWIPELTHNEGFRQKALLLIKDELTLRKTDPAAWRITTSPLNVEDCGTAFGPLRAARVAGQDIIAINLPRFAGLLAFFTQPGRVFADELSDRLKVIAGLERPNMLYSEMLEPVISEDEWHRIRTRLNAGLEDAQIVVWGASEDVRTAIEVIEERCRIAMTGVPNETRQSMPDGTTRFERVLPGPDRMYPDTDSAPIPIESSLIDELKTTLPAPVVMNKSKLDEWKVPVPVHRYLLRINFVGLIETLSAQHGHPPRSIALML